MLTGDHLLENFLVELQDDRPNKVVKFLKVLKYLKMIILGVTLLLKKRRKNLFEPIDENDYPASSFTNGQSALVTILIIFCACRGAELVRLQMYQWYEAKNGDWNDERDLLEN